MSHLAARAALAAVVGLPALCMAGTETAASVGAVDKVIQLLTDMDAKAKAGKQAEEVEYAKFAQFCQDKTAEKTKAIAEGEVLIERLTSTVGKLDSDMAELKQRIEENQETIATSEASKEEAKAQRVKDRAGYEEAIDAHAEAVSALERAIAVLKKQDFDRAQAGDALLQLQGAEGLPDEAHRAVAAFLEMQSGDDYLTREGPKANAYDFQSGGIVGLLEKLLKDFTQKHTDSQKEEMNSKHACDMILQDLHNTIEGAKSDITDSTTLMQEKRILRASAAKRLKVATDTHAEDVKFLADLKVEENEKGRSFQEKQGLRDEEMEAMRKAIEILSSDEVLGAAQQHLPAALLQRTTAHALVQLGGASHGHGASPEIRRALADFLKNEGHRLGSKPLGLLASQVVSFSDGSSNPFGKVKKLIMDLIQKLLREAGEEAEHKGWCDTELGTNKITRTKLQSDMDGLTARIDEDQAAIQEMTDRRALLGDEVKELHEDMVKATTLRTAEKAQNEATIEDAQGAQKAIAAATAILKDFYAKAGDATALLQASERRKPIQYDRVGNEHITMDSEEWNALANPNAEEVDRGHKEGMQTFGRTYKGRQDEAGGVLAILEVVASDFATLEAATHAAEDEAAQTYQAFMADANKNVAVKEKESSMLDADTMETKARLAADTTDLKSTQDQMLAAERYFERLKPQCIDQGVTWAQRSQARQAEIQSLQEALKMLTTEEQVA